MPTGKSGNGKWIPRFLEAFRNSGNIRASCQAAGVSRYAPLKHAQRHPEFREQMEEARQDAIDTLEAIAWQRAKSTSDYLLWKLLQANRRQLYGDRATVEFEVSDAVKELAAKMGLTEDELEEAMRAVDEAQRIVTGRTRA